MPARFSPELPPTALLRNALSAIHPLPDPVWQALEAVWQPFSASRKAILTQAGETERWMYFVLAGAQRAYALTPDGREATVGFTYPGNFSGVADSFLLQQPSPYVLETLDASQFLRASFEDIDRLMQEHHAVERMIRLAISRVLAGLIERQIELQAFTAEERLQALLRRSPHVFQLIPHKYLANYLGMDPANFSKILGKRQDLPR